MAALPAPQSKQGKRTVPCPAWHILPSGGDWDTTISDLGSVTHLTHELRLDIAAQSWSRLQTLASGTPALPNLRHMRIVIDGSTFKSTDPARYAQFIDAAEAIGPVKFRSSVKLEILYLPHVRTLHTRYVGRQPDDVTFARDEVQEFLCSQIYIVGGFAEGTMGRVVEGERYPGRRVGEDGMTEDVMRVVYERGKWTE
jgi:hypothetical protein